MTRQHQRSLRLMQHLDFDHSPIKCGNDKTLEILSGVVATLIAEEAQRHRLAEPQSIIRIRSPVYPGHVARLTDVRSELVDFAVDCDSIDIRTRVGNQVRSVRIGGYDGAVLGEFVVADAPVESRFEDRG